MDDVDYWLKPVNQLAISFAKFFEFSGLIFEYLKDVVGRAAILKALSKGVGS